MRSYRSPENFTWSSDQQQAVGFGDDMWALGLLMAELVTGRDTIKRMHGGRLVPVSSSTELQLTIAAEVADALGNSSQLFLLFACLLHREPALRLTAGQMQLWLEHDAAPQGVRYNSPLVAALNNFRRIRSQRQTQIRSQLAANIASSDAADATDATDAAAAAASDSTDATDAAAADAADADAPSSGPVDDELLAALDSHGLKELADKLADRGFGSLEKLVYKQWEDEDMDSLGMDPDQKRRFSTLLEDEG